MLTASLGLLERVVLAEDVLELEDTVSSGEVTGEVELHDGEVNFCEFNLL